MASKTNPTRIQLKGTGTHEERRAAAAIRPGDLVQFISTDKVQKHPTAGGPAEPAFALEDALQGRGIDDNYAADELVAIGIQTPGDVVYAWLSGGENAVIGAYLTSNGDGALKVAGGTDSRIGVAVTAVNAADSNDVDERIRVRLL